MKAPLLEIRHRMDFFGLFGVFVTVRSSSSFPSSFISLVGKDSFSLPCAALCVWLWESFWIVRESAPLSGLAFPMRSFRLRGGMQRPTNALKPFSFQQPLMVAATTEFWAVCVTPRLDNTIYFLARGGLFSTVIKKPGKKDFLPMNQFR